MSRPSIWARAAGCERRYMAWAASSACAIPLGEISFVDTRTRDRSLTVGATALASRPLGQALVLSALLDARHEAFFPATCIHEAQRLPGQPAVRRGGRQRHPLDRPLAAGADGLAAGRRRPTIRSAPNMIWPGDRRPPSGRPATSCLWPGWASVRRRIRGLRLRANAGPYARLPTLFERYGNGGNIVGNPALVPESGLNADLGATCAHRGAGPRCCWTRRSSCAASRDLIHFEQKGYFAGYPNVARARSLGGELSPGAQRARGSRAVPQGHLHRRSRPQRRHRPRRAAAAPASRACAPTCAPSCATSPPVARFTVGLYGELEATGGRYQDRPTWSRSRAGWCWARAPRWPTARRAAAGAVRLQPDRRAGPGRARFPPARPIVLPHPAVCLSPYETGDRP